MDDLCAASNVTKSALFHPFKSKDDLAVAAVEYWSKVTGQLFAAARRIGCMRSRWSASSANLEFRKQLLKGDVAEFTCLVGTMVQETFESSPATRAACEASISWHVEKIETDIVEAMRQRGVRTHWTAKKPSSAHASGPPAAFILAKATYDAKIAAASKHLRRYIEYLFNPANQKGKQS